MKKALRRVIEIAGGLSPESIVLVLAIGLVLGTFPIFGLPTFLCLAAGWCLRVSIPALQAVNQLVSPLQWALLLPLSHAGSRIFGAHVSASSVAGSVGMGMLHAVGGWFCICVPLGFVVYATLMLFLRLREYATR